MEDDLVRLAATSQFRALMRDTAGLFISPVGNRWALKGDHDALNGATIKKAVDAATDKPDEDDTRTPAQRRAAGLGRISRFLLDQGERPTEDGERPHIQISMKLETLLAGQLETTGDLALTTAQISQLLCESKISRIVTDAQGNPLDVSPAVYRPSRRLRRAVLFRDGGRCRYPGCDRTHGQVHHVISFPDGTTLTVTNPDRRRIGSTQSNT
jgi:hypothetical protein